MIYPEDILKDLYGKRVSNTILSDSETKRRVEVSTILSDEVASPSYICYEDGRYVQSTSSLTKAVRWWLKLRDPFPHYKHIQQKCTEGCQILSREV